MKKILLVTLVIVTFAVVWWNKTPPHTAPIIAKKTPEEILANDYEKIAKNLKPQNISNDEWTKINTYSLTPMQIVTPDTAAGFFKTAQNNIPDIYSCLKKDFCGMETRGEDDAYFDDQRTPAHILINRNLKIMKESLKKDNALKSLVDWNLMNELAASDAEMLSVEALDIIREYNSESVKTDELIKLTEHYKGDAKADALVRISKRKNPSDKLLLVNEIEEVFASSDNNTVISVLEEIKAMGLTASQSSKPLRNLCRFKDDNNWKMIKYEANKINPEFEKNCN